MKLSTFFLFISLSLAFAISEESVSQNSNTEIKSPVTFHPIHYLGNGEFPPSHVPVHPVEDEQSQGNGQFPPSHVPVHPVASQKNGASSSKYVSSTTLQRLLALNHASHSNGHHSSHDSSSEDSSSQDSSSHDAHSPSTQPGSDATNKAGNQYPSVDTYLTYLQQLATIEALKAQIELLTITEEKLNVAAENVHSKCAADFELYCKNSIEQSQPPNEQGEYFHALHHRHGMGSKHRLLRSDSESFSHSQRHSRTPRLGFGSRQADQCMMSHLMKLSSSCQDSINVQFEMNEMYTYQNSEEFSHSGCPGKFLIFAVVLLVFSCIARRHHKRAKKMRKFLDVVYDNAEIKSVVEGLAGEPLPPRPRCCMDSGKKAVLRKFFLIWLLVSTIIGIYYISNGVAADIVITAIFSSTIHLIVFSVIIAIIIRMFKKCFKCLCNRNSESVTEPNQVSQQLNRISIQPITFQSPPSAAFQYQPIPQYDQSQLSNDQANFELRNGHYEMAFAGIPYAVQPNN